MNISTFIICLIIVAIGVCGILSYKKKLKNGCCGAGGGDIKIPPSDTDESHYAHKAIVSISGMTCANCASRIENLFNRRQDCMARVNLRRKRAEIWSKSDIDSGDIKRAIENIGYIAERIDIEK